jgi:predicted Zn-dependent protease with MMP-like domain/Tfp pilus assembly protein PilF
MLVQVTGGRCDILARMSEEGADRGQRLEEAWRLLEDGEVEAALCQAENLLAEEDGDPEAHYLAGFALMEASRLEDAEPHLRRALEIDPGDLDARAALAELLYEVCRFEEARAEVGLLLESDPEDSHAHHLASLLAERRGAFAEAEEEERMAHRLAHGTYPLPPRFTRAEFDASLQSAAAELPVAFRDRMENLAIVVEDVPSMDLLKTLEDPTPSLLGLFVGTPLPEQHLDDLPRPPDAVYLFKRNLERVCESREELVEEIRITLLHEVGHFMGLDEQQLAESGYE